MKKKLLLVTGLIAASASASASAADGCKFLLCMGAPNPMGISECAPTVKEVLHDLSRGKSFPKCKLENGQDSETTGNYVSYYMSPLPSCPDGYRNGKNGTTYYTGARHGYGRNGVEANRYTRVCVKGKSYPYYNRREGTRGIWYEDMKVLGRDGKKYNFTMFVDGQIFSKHRF